MWEISSHRKQILTKVSRRTLVFSLEITGERSRYSAKSALVVEKSMPRFFAPWHARTHTLTYFIYRVFREFLLWGVILCEDLAIASLSFREVFIVFCFWSALAICVERLIFYQKTSARSMQICALNFTHHQRCFLQHTQQNSFKKTT